jgi:hypothetical protein
MSDSRMTALAMTFPSLRGRGPQGVTPWDPIAFLEWATSGMPGGGARRAALFILYVWNHYADWREVALERGFITTEASAHCLRFDLAEAFGAWDEHHHAAFLRWAEHPWFA